MWPDLAQYAGTCLGPDCCVTLEDDAPFCSQRCEDLFTQWADDMAVFYDDHETELWELGDVS
jgi:endogenous inhibitor of DNA gyrase (YacG/DUF329 family)